MWGRRVGSRVDFDKTVSVEPTTGGNTGLVSDVESEIEPGGRPSGTGDRTGHTQEDGRTRGQEPTEGPPEYVDRDGYAP